MEKIFNILQNYLMDMVSMVQGLPLLVAILVILAIIIIPDPLVILGSIVMKKIKQ